MKNFFLNIFLIIFFSVDSLALSTEDKLENPQDEQRAMNLFLQIRCLVCAGQVIENSDTQFAHDVRKFVRKKINEGLNDEEIKAYLIKNFGDEILQTPTLKSQPLLWLLPLIFLPIALIFTLKNYRKFIFNNN
jgi:cytochrome c-type biogenesis protein CcmH